MLFNRNIMNRPTFRVIIAGGREFSDYQQLCHDCDHILANKMKTHTVIVICGMARGADKLGRSWAIDRGLQVEEFPAEWFTLGKKAGFVRNQQMADVAQGLIAFPGGTGTADMIARARAKGLLIRANINNKWETK